MIKRESNYYDGFFWLIPEFKCITLQYICSSFHVSVQKTTFYTVLKSRMEYFTFCDTTDVQMT